MGVPSSATARLPPRRWERWTDASHLYLLPVAAGGLALGGAIVAGAPRGLDEYAPAALIALGAEALASAILYRGGRRHAARLLGGPAPVRVSGSPRANSVPTAPPSAGADAVAHREWASLVRRAWHTAVPVPPAPPSPDPFAAAGPLEAIRQRWPEAHVGRLPVEPVGPVPETARTPPAPGSYAPFPSREPPPMALGGAVGRIPGNGPLPQALAHPTEMRPDVPLPPVTASTSVEAFVGNGPYLRTDPPIATSLVATFPTTPEERMSGEALHPLPPELRGAAPTWTGPVPTVSHPSLPLSSIVCASCTRTFDEDGAWGPCPECGEPVCPGCRIRAVVEFGHTWCSSCGTGLGWETGFEPDRMAAAAAALTPTAGLRAGA